MNDFIDLRKHKTVNITHTKRNGSNKSIGITQKANQSLLHGSAHFKQFKQFNFFSRCNQRKENKTQEK